MGGGASGQQDQVFKQSEMGIMLLGATAKGSMLMNFSPGHIQSVRSMFRFPKYSHAFVTSEGIGYITGGVQELLSTSSELKSLDQQQYEGVISKKFIKVSIKSLKKNPDTAFSEMPDMINARYAHSAVEHQGSVYVFGGRQYGDDEIGILSACQKFNLSQNKWKSIPSLIYPRSGASSIIYGEHIYVFGGYCSKNQRVRVIESYIEGDTCWRKLPFKLHEGLEGALVLLNPSASASIFIFGGKTDYGKTNSIVQINFDKSSIRYYKPLKQSRCFHKGFINDKTAFILGGGADSIQSYDLSTGISTTDKQTSYLEHCTTKQLASLCSLQPQIKLSHKNKPYFSPNYKNKAFIFGHSKQPFSKIIDLDNFVIISESQSLYHNFYKFPTVAKVNKETCFIMGGINSELTEVTDVVYSFNIITQEIVYLQPMKSPKYGFSSAVKGSYLYIAGGRKLGGDDVAILASCQRFSFESYKWESIAPLKFKRHSSMLLTVGNFLLAIGGYRGNGVRSNQIQLYIEQDNRWVQVDQKFELAAEAMSSITYMNEIYLFGGRAQQIDIQKVFKLHLTVDQGKKYEKSVKISLQPVGNLTNSGTNLKVYLDKTKALAYVFGDVKSGIDVYDLKKHKVVHMEKLSVFQYLEDPFFQTYTIVF